MHSNPARFIAFQDRARFVNRIRRWQSAGNFKYFLVMSGLSRRLGSFKEELRCLKIFSSKVLVPRDMNLKPESHEIYLVRSRSKSLSLEGNVEIL